MHFQPLIPGQVKGAFLRTKKELMNASSDLMRAEDQVRKLQTLNPERRTVDDAFYALDAGP
jgi:hypothetical protein